MSYRPDRLIVQIQTISPLRGENWSLETSLSGQRCLARPSQGATITSALFFKNVLHKFPFTPSGRLQFILSQSNQPVAVADFDLSELAGNTSATIDEQVQFQWMDGGRNGTRPRLSFVIQLDPPLPNAHNMSVWGMQGGDVADLRTSHPDNLLFDPKSVKMGGASMWTGLVDGSLAPNPLGAAPPARPPNRLAHRPSALAEDNRYVAPQAVTPTFEEFQAAEQQTPLSARPYAQRPRGPKPSPDVSYRPDIYSDSYRANSSYKMSGELQSPASQANVYHDHCHHHGSFGSRDQESHSPISRRTTLEKLVKKGIELIRTRTEGRR